MEPCRNKIGGDGKCSYRIAGPIPEIDDRKVGRKKKKKRREVQPLKQYGADNENDTPGEEEHSPSHWNLVAIAPVFQAINEEQGEYDAREQKNVPPYDARWGGEKGDDEHPNIKGGREPIKCFRHKPPKPLTFLPLGK